MMNDDLHCFSNGTTTVAAIDVADARTVMLDMYGHDDDVGTVEPVPDDTRFAVWLDEAQDALPVTKCECREYNWTYQPRQTQNGHHTLCAIGHPSKTAREWARDTGRGIVCSTEV